MFKQILTFSVSISLLQSFGQTLSSDNIWPVPEQFLTVRTASPVVETEGTGQFWNYKNVVTTSIGALVSYLSPGAVPSSSSYPGCNIVQLFDQKAEYLICTLNGIKLSSADSWTVNAPETLLPFPFSFGDSYNETILRSKNVTNGVMIHKTVNSFTANGTGTLSAPSGTFYNVVRVKKVSVETWEVNGVPVYDTNTTVRNYYYAPKFPHPVFYTFSKTSSGLTDYAPYSQYVQDKMTAIDELEMTPGRLSLQPNPSNGLLRIMGEDIENSDLSIVDLQGADVYNTRTLNNRLDLDLTRMQDGIYFITVTKRNTVSRQKLIICH